MKRSLLSAFTILIFFLLFSITACSSQVDSAKGSVSFSLSSKACEKLRERAAENGKSDTSLTLKVALVAPYDIYSKQESLTEDEKGPVTLTFTEIPVGTKIMAKAWIYQGDEEIAYGESGEIEVQEEGSELAVKLEYTKELPKSATIEIKIDGETTVTANEIKLLATESKVSPSANASTGAAPIEYDIFNISLDSATQELLKDSDLTWKIDGFEENEKGMTLKVYKDLLPSGSHTVSLLAIDKDKKYYIGETQVSVEREKEERIVFVSTERGLEFRINRFTSDNWFENTCLEDTDTNIIVYPIFEKGMSGWKGYWPFVEPNGVYQFVLKGSLGDYEIDENTFKKSEMDYRNVILDPVTYIGERNTPITSEMYQIIKAFRSADDLSVDTSEGYARVSISEDKLGPFTNIFEIYKDDPYLKVTKSFTTFTIWKDGWSWLAGYDYTVDDKMPSSLNNYDIIANLPENDWGRNNVIKNLSNSDRFFVELEPAYNFNGDKNQFFKISNKKSPTGGENMAVWQH